MLIAFTLMLAAQTEAQIPAGATVPESGNGNWIVQRCEVYGRGYCRIPFHVAMNAAGDIGASKRKILLRGYLVKEPEGFALYSDIGAARRGWRTDAILIEAPADQSFQKSLVHWNQALVEVRGHLTLVASDHDEYRIQMTLEGPVSLAGIRGEKLRD
jgi:hypothetical protein